MALGEKAKSEDDLMVIKPTLFGERHDPNLKGSVANLTSHNMGLGQVTRGICKGKYFSSNTMRKDLLNLYVSVWVGKMLLKFVKILDFY